jgi:hypothetical protein
MIMKKNPYSAPHIPAWQPIALPINLKLHTFPTTEFLRKPGCTPSAPGVMHPHPKDSMAKLSESNLG